MAATKIITKSMPPRIHRLKFKIPKREAGPCEKKATGKRLLSMGAGFEQREWTPTARKGPIGAETASPGPAFVKLPPLVSVKIPDSKKNTAPSYSFGRKHRTSYATSGPGPSQYDITGMGVRGKETPLAATLQGRAKPKSSYKTPAPGQYNIGKSYKVAYKDTPKYSFGKKPAELATMITPAPNVYKIPSVLGQSKEGPIRSAPAFSLAGREKTQTVPPFNVPGPGSYNGEYMTIKRRPPMYSMRGKFDPLDDNKNKPGPGAHCPESYVQSKSTPAPSFGIIHSKWAGKPKFCLIPDSVTKAREKARWCI